MTIILATNNRHKRDELAQVLLSELGDTVTLKTLEEVGLGGLDIPETGVTLEENALIKARTVHERTGHSTLADDTGLEVEALHGAPGVYSARYAGVGATYADNVTKLLASLEGAEDRSATFKTVIAFIDASEKGEYLFSGSVQGTIVSERRGSHGFGYDPIFEPLESNGLTFAQMTPEAKNKISHRSRALLAFSEFLKKSL